MKILSALAGVFLAGLVAAPAQAVTVHYDYDAASNRTGETVRKNDGTLIKELKYHYDSAGRLSAIENLTDPAQTETFTYDGNGNQISRTAGTQHTTYAFDARDQLTTVEKSEAGGPPVLQARYRYNADGMRIDGEENGQARRYTWDSDQLILTQEPDNTLSRYQWGPNRLSSMISTEGGTSKRDWYFFDGLGSITALVSDTGALSARYRFDAFGKITEQTGDTNNRFTFTGHQFDDITSLYYFKARYYDPSQGRFVSADAYEGTLLTPESRLDYLYANANPLLFIDPDGHEAIVLPSNPASAVLVTGEVVYRGSESAAEIVATHATGVDYSNSREQLIIRFVDGAKGAFTGAANAYDQYIGHPENYVSNPDGPLFGLVKTPKSEAQQRVIVQESASSPGKTISPADTPNLPLTTADSGGKGRVKTPAHTGHLPPAINDNMTGFGAGSKPRERAVNETPNQSGLIDNSPYLAESQNDNGFATPLSPRELKNARQRGVERAKSAERDLIVSGHPGTVDDEGWTWAERKQIAETGQFPADVRMHHINDVKQNPELSDNSDNVIPSRGGAAGHVEKYHPAGTRAGSSGKLLDRQGLKAEHMNGN